MNRTPRARRTRIEWAEDAIRVVAIVVSCSIAALAATDRLGIDEPIVLDDDDRHPAEVLREDEPADLIDDSDWVNVAELENVPLGDWRDQAGVSLAVLSVVVDPEQSPTDSFGDTLYPVHGKQFVVVRFGMHNHTREIVRDFCVAGIELLDDTGEVHTVSDVQVAGNIHCLMGLRPDMRHVDRIVFEIDDDRTPVHVSFWNPADDEWGYERRFDVYVGS